MGWRALRTAGVESRWLEIQRKRGGETHLMLNMSPRPIANKYREGKMKSTLKRESKGLETANREAYGRDSGAPPIRRARPSFRFGFLSNSKC